MKIYNTKGELVTENILAAQKAHRSKKILDVVDFDAKELLEDILIQLKIANLHLKYITKQEYTKYDVEE